MRRSESEPLAVESLATTRGLHPSHTMVDAARQQECDRLALADVQRQLAGGITKLRRPDVAWRGPRPRGCSVRLRP